MKIGLELQAKKKNGTCRVRIRVNENGKQKRYSTEVSLKPNEINLHATFGAWVKSNHPHSKELNNYLADEVSKYRKGVVLFPKETFLIEYANKLLKQKEAELSPLTAQQFSAKVNRLKKFLKDQDTLISNVNQSFIKEYRGHLKKEGLSDNSIKSVLSGLRVILNSAISDRLLSKDNYPFGVNGVKIGSIAGEIKFLSVDQISKMMNLELEGRANDIRNMFLLQLFLEGLRVSDVLRLKRENVIDGVISWTEKKKGGQARKTKIPTPAIEIVNYYLNDGNSEEGFLFPFMKSESEKQIASWTAQANKYLKDIGKKLGVEGLTTHAARHSAAILAQESGMHQGLIQQLLRHSKPSMTDAYLKRLEVAVSDVGSQLFDDSIFSKKGGDE